MAEQFKATIDQLDGMISKLEVSTGTSSAPSTVTTTQQTVKTEKVQSKQQVQPKQKNVEKPKKEKAPQGEKKVEQKKQKKKQEELAPGTVDDFALIDIRVGEIKQVWKHPQSDNLYCQKIDIGEETVRQIGSGLQKYVPIEQMSGLVLVMANLKPRKLAGFMSNGMVVANSNADHTQIFLAVPKGAKVGERVVLQGFEQKFSQDRQPQLNPKKKILQKCVGLLSTDAEGAAMWNGHKLKTSAGYIICQIPNAHLS